MLKMGSTVGLLLLTLLCIGIGRVQGECRHVNNDDMIEYSCEGGQLSDLDDLPKSTGKIRITNMPISRITTNTFSRFGSELWVLGLSHCGIVDIEPGAFRHLENLQQLSLDNNYLTAIKESWFKGLEYLTFLDLNYNNIHTIEDGVFKNLPSLIDLRLSGNRLECLNLEAMSHLKLQRMFLSENSEFKCPNAVSTYLENRGVMFERDPEWSNIPDDLVAVEGPFEYDIEYEESTSAPTTSLPTYRERLHLTSPNPVRSTPSNVPPRLYTTEDVVYRPAYVTPDWRTTLKPSTIAYEGVEQPTTVRPPYDVASRVQVPSRVIYVHSTTDSPPDARQFDNLDETTLGSWPSFPESTSARPEFPLYPHHENEDRRYEATNPFPLAPGPGDRHEMPPFVESNVERTTRPSEVAWPERNTVPWDREYPSVVDNGPPEYRVPPTVAPVTLTHVVQSMPPETIQPAWPEVFQAPYYEHTITVHPPPLESNPPNQEGAATGVPPIETTTDKPLPNCSHKNLSSMTGRSLALLVVSVLLVFAGDVFVEGF